MAAVTDGRIQLMDHQEADNQIVLQGAPEGLEDNFKGPEGFEQGLRELYVRSFAECGLKPDVVEKCLTELDAPFGLLTDGFSTHTKLMWQCDRLDLTIERLALADEWRSGFNDYDVQEVSRKFRALEYLRLARN